MKITGQIKEWASIVSESEVNSFSPNNEKDCLIFDPKTNTFLQKNGQYKADIYQADRFDFEEARKIQFENSIEEKPLCILRWY